jgi:hypothetical protein
MFSAIGKHGTLSSEVRALSFFTLCSILESNGSKDVFNQRIVRTRSLCRLLSFKNIALNTCTDHTESIRYLQYTGSGVLAAGANLKS